LLQAASATNMQRDNTRAMSDKRFFFIKSSLFQIVISKKYF